MVWPDDKKICELEECGVHFYNTIWQKGSSRGGDSCFFAQNLRPPLTLTFADISIKMADRRTTVQCDLLFIAWDVVIGGPNLRLALFLQTRRLKLAIFFLPSRP